MSHDTVIVHSHRQPCGSHSNQESRQQASQLLSATTHVVGDLSRQLHADAQDGPDSTGRSSLAQAAKNAASLKVIDVTNSTDGSNPEPELPFPVFALPFAVP